jgi:prepilin-type N-terminal cleavage/methylation domain-containing protein
VGKFYILTRTEILFTLNTVDLLQLYLFADKNMNTLRRVRKGFTLIELLIVIGLLGTLAVALLAAIDPFEQFRKGTDTGVRNTVQEFYNASIRYYAQKNGWPSGPNGWQVTPSTVLNINFFGDATLKSRYVQPLIDAGELKSNFIDLGGDQLDSMRVSILDSKMLVCFKPVSRSLLNSDKNVKYTDVVLDANGNPSTDNTATPVCKVNGGTTDCNWCIY